MWTISSSINVDSGMRSGPKRPGFATCCITTIRPVRLSGCRYAPNLLLTRAIFDLGGRVQYRIHPTHSHHLRVPHGIALVICHLTGLAHKQVNLRGGRLYRGQVSPKSSNGYTSTYTRIATKLRSLFDGGRSTVEESHRRTNSQSALPQRRVSREEMHQAGMCGLLYSSLVSHIVGTDSKYRLENIRLNRALERSHLNMEKAANVGIHYSGL